MINKKRILPLLSLIVSVAMLTACNSTNTGKTAINSSTTNGESSTIINNASPIQAVSVKYDSEDYYFNWKSQSYQTIHLSNDSTTINISGIDITRWTKSINAQSREPD